eukprot:230897_1
MLTPMEQYETGLLVMKEMQEKGETKQATMQRLKEERNRIWIFVSFVMNRLVQQKVAYNNYNLFKPIIFKLFSNLKEIIIYSTDDTQVLTQNAGTRFKDTVYSFDILRLLSILTTNSLPKSFERVIIKEPYPWKSGEWLKNAFTEHVKQAFMSKKINIELKTNQGEERRFVNVSHQGLGGLFGKQRER